MYSRRTLTTKFKTLPLVSLSGPWSRCVANEYLQGPPPGAPPGSPPRPLWPGGSKLYGQRFTPKGGFDTLYLALSPATALLEVRTIINVGGNLVHVPSNPMMLVSIQGTVNGILDLTDPNIQRELGTSTAELTGAWAFTAAGGTPPTQRLGAAAFASGRIHGFKYYSAKGTGSEICLAVFPARLDASTERLQVLDSSGTIVDSVP